VACVTVAKEAAEAKEADVRAIVKSDADKIGDLERELNLVYSWLSSLTKIVSSTLNSIKSDCKGKAVSEINKVISTLDEVDKGQKEVEALRAADQASTAEDVSKVEEGKLLRKITKRDLLWLIFNHKETRKAQDEHRNTESTLSSKETELSELQKADTVDLGPDGGMGILQTGCLTYDSPEYIYELCFFNRATQRSKNGGETYLGYVIRHDLLLKLRLCLQFTLTVGAGQDSPERTLPSSVEKTSSTPKGNLKTV
jgi:hypothetical protein